VIGCAFDNGLRKEKSARQIPTCCAVVKGCKQFAGYALSEKGGMEPMNTKILVLLALALLAACAQAQQV
jgi:hypothetical protein